MDKKSILELLEYIGIIEERFLVISILKKYSIIQLKMRN